MTESLAVRIRSDNQDVVKDWPFFQDGDILGYEVYRTEIKLYCSYDKLRDGHVESNRSHEFSS